MFRLRTSAIVIAVILLVAQHPATADLLVGSWQTDSVRRYDDSGNYLGDFVPPASGGLDLPDGMDFGADGHLYVSSSNTNAILRYNGTTGASMGAFVSKGLDGPGNLRFGPDGFLYVCNKNTGQVLRFDPVNGDLVDVFASGGGLVQPVGLLWDGGLLYVADFSGGAVRRYNATTGVYFDDFASVVTPLILHHDLDGNIMVSSHNLDNILRFDTDGNALGAFLSGGPLDCPVGYVFDDLGQLIVASWQNHRLLRYDAQSGSYLGEFAVGNGLFLPNDALRFPQNNKVTIPPNAFQAFRGSYVSGDLNSLAESDDEDLCYQPGFIINSSEAPVWLTFSGTLPSDNPNSLSFNIESSASTVGLTYTVEMRDQTARGEVWIEIGAVEETNNVDTVETFDLTSDIDTYVNSKTGQIQARVGWRKTGFVLQYPWTVCIDQVFWTVD